MTGITIRPARPDEYARIGEITVAAYTAIEETGSDVIDDYMNELRDVATRAKDAEVIVAVNGIGDVLGSVTLVLDPSSSMAEWEEDGAVGFRMLAVAPEAQGLGAGKLLAEHCVARARQVGAQTVLIHSRHVMTKARAIYKQMGFRRSPETDFAVEDIRIDGYRLDL